MPPYQENVPPRPACAVFPIFANPIMTRFLKSKNRLLLMISILRRPSIRRNGCEKILADADIRRLGGKIDGFLDLPPIEAVILGKALFHQLANPSLHFRQPPADGRFVDPENPSDLAHGHL